MANLDVAVNGPSIGTGVVAKTLLEYTAPATSGATVRRWGVSFDGTSPTAAPILVGLLQGRDERHGHQHPPVKISGHTGNPLGTAKHTMTVEPGGSPV